MAVSPTALCPLSGLPQGTAAEQDVLVKRLRHMLGDLTFMDAFHHTGAPSVLLVLFVLAGFCCLR